MRSTGPRTIAGKQIAARNAIRHGLTSKSVLLPGDDPAQYERFATGIRTYWSPNGEQEEFLVQLIIDAAWVRLRFSNIEAGVLRFLLSDEIEPDVFAEASNRVLETLSRYGTTKERTLTRAMRDLERLQDRRKRNASPSVGQRLIGGQDQAPPVGAMVAERLRSMWKEAQKKATKAGKVDLDANPLGSEASRTTE